MTAEDVAPENFAGSTSADSDSQSMTHKENVNFQMPITTFSQLNVDNIAGDDHHRPISQPTPAQSNSFQHLSPYSSRTVAGHYKHQIAEFRVPVDMERTTSQTVLSQPQTLQPIHVPDEMPFSIITTIFFCFFLGMAAIIFAAQANRLRSIDPKKALSKAEMARLLNVNAITVSVFTTFTVILVYFVVLKY